MQEQTAPLIFDASSEQVADTVMLLVLMRGQISAKPVCDEGNLPVAPLVGRTIGLVGFDAVARAVARRACHGFGMRVLIYSDNTINRAELEALGAASIGSLDRLLAEADFVSLHGRPGGAPIINAHRLNQMKPDACLINAVHGALVDEQALIHALWFETIGGAGLAIPSETLDRKKDFEACEHAILLPNVVDVAAPAPPANQSIISGNVIPLFEHDPRV